MYQALPIESHEQKIVTHKKKGLSITPIYAKDCTLNYSDEYFAHVYRRLVREETVYKIFYDGSVRNTNDFIKFIRDKKNELFFVEYDGKEVGFFWLTKFREKSAFINYCFYKRFWGEKALHISKSCIGFLFNRIDAYGDHILDVLLGLTPVTNKLAITFLLKNGMKVIGKIPGMLYDFREEKTVDAVFSYKQRIASSKIKIPTFFFLN